VVVPIPRADERRETPMDVMHGHWDAAAATTLEAPARVLVHDADTTTADAVSAILRHEGHVVVTARRAEDVGDSLREGRYDIILLGLDTDRMLGDKLVCDARDLCPEGSIILLAGYAELEIALSSLRKGVYAYLMKPVDVEEMRGTVLRALERQRLRHAVVAAQSQEHALRARLRQEVDDATEDLQRRVAELSQANQELLETQELHDRFVAMVAHEMRGPLNPIIAYAQLAQRPTLPREKLDNYMNMIIEHAFRLNRLIDDLRTATRLNTGQFSLQRRTVDLCEAVAEVVDQFTSSIHERRFLLERPDEPILAYVDRDRILQAVRNLVDNAVKYTSDDGAIEVHVWREDRRACISVADYGAGLTAEEMRQIFDAFARGNQSRDVAGSGLGLYITRGIAEAHGGYLAVRNREGEERARGAIFTIFLPLDKVDRPNQTEL
jgi:signal transduction histidine kinase